MFNVRLITRKKKLLFKVVLVSSILITILNYLHSKAVVNSEMKKTPPIVTKVTKGPRQTIRGVEYACAANILVATGKDDQIRWSGDATVTWCSVSSDNNLHYLHKLSSFWEGPISVAVFTQIPNLKAVLTYLSSMYHCDANIKARVTVHLCVHESGWPLYLDTLAFDKENISCDGLMERHDNTMNYGDTDIAFPVNMLRNVAMSNANTQYVLNADIDLVPSIHLHQAFGHFIRTFNGTNGRLTAFVLPSFETNETIHHPISKEALLSMWTKQSIRPFYDKVCSTCQYNTDYKRWRDQKTRGGLSVLYYRTWKYPWEPFLITHKQEVPRFDERFKRYGFNRISQMCELHVKGFQFAVLDNGFLIHDGFKEKSSFHKDRNKENNMNHEIYRTLKTELRLKYNNTGRTCNTAKQPPKDKGKTVFSKSKNHVDKHPHQPEELSRRVFLPSMTTKITKDKKKRTSRQPQERNRRVGVPMVTSIVTKEKNFKTSLQHTDRNEQAADPSMKKINSKETENKILHQPQMRNRRITVPLMHTRITKEMKNEIPQHPRELTRQEANSIITEEKTNKTSQQTKERYGRVDAPLAKTRNKTSQKLKAY